jgi:hypothetical protein
MRSLILVFLLFSILPVRGQVNYADPAIFTSHVFNEKIKSVLLYREGWNLSYPVIKLKSDDRLVLSFDLLDNRPETFYYTFIHCNKDWERSDIITNEFLDGYPENQVEDYRNSFNTTVNYFHYNLVFPDNMVKFSLSGNYILVIYAAGRPEEPALTQRFVVTEDAVNISASVHRPQLAQFSNTHQQIDFTVNYTGLNITDPYREVYSFILQNGRWDNARKNLKPDLYGNNELKYNSLSENNLFPGGNEFRYFDIKSIRYKTEYVRSVDFVAPYYNVYLYPSENREFKPYFYWQDFNGKYYIAVQEGQKAEIDADYVYVYFTLPAGQMISGGQMYASGNLNGWAFNSNNRMNFNPGKSQYECSMLLKQGWYNYEYVYLKNGSADGTATLFEGSHYETENDYTILVYYRNPHGRYDRVIGSVTANTLNRLRN